MFKFKKSQLKKTAGFIEDITQYSQDLLTGKSKFESVKSVLEEIKAIADEHERGREIKAKAKLHAMHFKAIEAKRHLINKSTPAAIRYSQLSKEAQQRADHVLERLAAKLTLKKFMDVEPSLLKARIERNQVLKDLLTAKNKDLRRFQDMAKHWHEKLEL